jgi:hypothetical protein
MRFNWGALLTVLLLSAVACSDHGTISLVSPGGASQGAVAFRLLKNETPTAVWTVEARLGFVTLRKSVFVKSSSDTVTITMNGVAAGYWSVTVDAKDSAGTVLYAGTSSVQVVENQTAQALVQMIPAGGSGSVQIIMIWPPPSQYLQVRTAGDFFLAGQTVPVAISNVSNETVNPVSCCTRPDLRIQQKINGTWTPPGACELMCPSILLPMKPGQRILDSAIHIAQPGLYRLLLRYWPNNSRISALFEAYSNEFSVYQPRTDSVKLGEQFVLRFGEGVSVQNAGLKIVFQDVTEDSRCPEGAVCVWAGNARVLLGVNDSTIALNTMLDPKLAVLGKYVVRLSSLGPYPMIGQRIQKGDYVASLMVTGIIIR